MELHGDLRRVPIRRIGNRHNLFMGGDRELVMLAGLARLRAGVQRPGMARRHRRHAPVDWRFVPAAPHGQIRSQDATRFICAHRRYKAYYAARATPFRKNTRTQERQYR